MPWDGRVSFPASHFDSIKIRTIGKTALPYLYLFPVNYQTTGKYKYGELPILKEGRLYFGGPEKTRGRFLEGFFSDGLVKCPKNSI
jgi:hypothetical protein